MKNFTDELQHEWAAPFLPQLWQKSAPVLSMLKEETLPMQ